MTDGERRGDSQISQRRPPSRGLAPTGKSLSGAYSHRIRRPSADIGAVVASSPADSAASSTSRTGLWSRRCCGSFMSTATLVAREFSNILPQSAQSQFFELVADLGRLCGAYAWLAPVALPCQF